MALESFDVARLGVWAMVILISATMGWGGGPPGSEGNTLGLVGLVAFLLYPAVIAGLIAAWMYIRSDTKRAYMVFELIGIFVIGSVTFTWATGDWLVLTRDLYRGEPETAGDLFLTGLMPWLLVLGTVLVAITPYVRPMLRRRMHLSDS